MDTAFRHIAVCIDESDASRRALAEARRLRTFGEGRLTVLHVVQWPPPFSTGYGIQVDLEDMEAGGRRWLEEATADVDEGTAVVLHGHPAGEVVAWAGRHAVDLLICASHHGLAHRVALGSFAHHLVNHAPCPVLVLRSAEAAAGR
ncbi:MAG: universal stress protein [Thermoleophilia bacterium]